MCGPQINGNDAPNYATNTADVLDQVCSVPQRRSATKGKKRLETDFGYVRALGKKY